MDFFVETKTLYAITELGNAVQLKDFAFERIIGWGLEPGRSMRPVVFDEFGSLTVIEEDILAIIDFLPNGAKPWTYMPSKDNPRFSTMYEQLEQEISTRAGITT